MARAAAARRADAVTWVLVRCEPSLDASCGPLPRWPGQGGWFDWEVPRIRIGEVRKRARPGKQVGGVSVGHRCWEGCRTGSTSHNEGRTGSTTHTKRILSPVHVLCEGVCKVWPLACIFCFRVVARGGLTCYCTVKRFRQDQIYPQTVSQHTRHVSNGQRSFGPPLHVHRSESARARASE